MAEVYRAEVVGAAGFSRTVAIKRLHDAFSADQTFCDMFVREARLLSQLHHANIVSVLDFEWDHKGQLFLVMELVDGVDLAELVSKGRLPISVATHVVAAVLRALVHAHAHNIIHRDISPHNVLISWMGEVKLSDFGLAKATSSSHISPVGLVKGKVRYLSPDQIQGLDLDERADLFSAGVMFYELVTGHPPFIRDRSAQPTMAESIARMLTATIVPPRDLQPEVPAALEDMIMRLLERERDQRFATAQEALDALGNPSHQTEPLIQLLAERFPEADRRAAGHDAPPKSSGEIMVSLHERIDDQRATGSALQCHDDAHGSPGPARPGIIRWVLATTSALLVLGFSYSRYGGKVLGSFRTSASREIAPALAPARPGPPSWSSPATHPSPPDPADQTHQRAQQGEIMDADVDTRAPMVITTMDATAGATGDDTGDDAGARVVVGSPAPPSRVRAAAHRPSSRASRMQNMAPLRRAPALAKPPSNPPLIPLANLPNPLANLPNPLANPLAKPPAVPLTVPADAAPAPTDSITSNPASDDADTSEVKRSLMPPNVIPWQEFDMVTPAGAQKRSKPRSRRK